MWTSSKIVALECFCIRRSCLTCNLTRSRLPCFSMSVSFVSMIRLLFFFFEFSSSFMASEISKDSSISRPFAPVDFLPPNIDDFRPWFDVDDLPIESLCDPAESSEMLESLEFPLIMLEILFAQNYSVREYLNDSRLFLIFELFDPGRHSSIECNATEGLRTWIDFRPGVGLSPAWLNVDIFLPSSVEVRLSSPVSGFRVEVLRSSPISGFSVDPRRPLSKFGFNIAPDIFCRTEALFCNQHILRRHSRDCKNWEHVFEEIWTWLRIIQESR